MKTRPLLLAGCGALAGLGAGFYGANLLLQRRSAAAHLARGSLWLEDGLHFDQPVFEFLTRDKPLKNSGRTFRIKMGEFVITVEQLDVGVYRLREPSDEQRPEDASLDGYQLARSYLIGLATAGIFYWRKGRP